MYVYDHYIKYEELCTTLVLCATAYNEEQTTDVVAIKRYDCIMLSMTGYWWRFACFAYNSVLIMVAVYLESRSCPLDGSA